MTPNPHCRIRRVRLKSNGAVIERVRTEVDRDSNYLHARLAASQNAFNAGLDPMGGFVLVAWKPDGTYMIDWFTYRHIPQTLLPSWVADMLRREMAKDVAHEAIDERMQEP